MSPKESDPDFLLTRPEEIRSALFELTHPECQILVRDAADREMAVLVLGTDKQTRHFFWRPRDYAGADFEKNDVHGLRVGSVLQFHANGYGGVQIHFRVPRPDVVRFDDGSAALVSPYPERLSRIQRRKMFRASITGNSVRCGGHWRPAPGAKPIVFTVRDISVDGVGLRINRAVEDLPPPGTKMEDVYLDFGDFGNITTDLEIRTLIPLAGQPLKPETDAEKLAAADGLAATSVAPQVDAQEASDAKGSPKASTKGNTKGSITGEDPLTHVGAAFLILDGRQETWLQQVVWRLEKARTMGS
ncbi:flagellar brake protein [Achromobacter aloeverae]|uniref:Flagellar brake protein n=1 Tax=Achromobacter aloeverae TaxID=1750518 RepID=A0A4Q1HNI2_9BURK|nr:flagellar brake protein [Achromobacter aloeverae]RXN92538.1 flagellar brake protein [Achromobacter aloeverae]